MEGKRLPNNQWPLNPGEYAKHDIIYEDINKPMWFFIPPKPGIGLYVLSLHTIVENSNGTITVSPSIVINTDDKKGIRWHGFLIDGDWREC